MKRQNLFYPRAFLAILLLLFLIGNFISGQDIIVKKNGDEIKAKIDQVLDLEIRYHKFENLSGPVYSIAKSEIFMIKYENGTKDVFATQSEQAVSKPQQTPKVSFTSRDINSARTGAILNYALIAPILVLGTLSAVTSNTDVDTSTGFGILGTVVIGVGIPVSELIASKTRRTTRVRGSIGLRIAGWAGYGLTLADAITLLALSDDEDVNIGPGLIISVAILGAMSTTCLGLDNSTTVLQAKRLQPKITLQPKVGSFRDYTGRHQTIGIRINF